MTHLIGMGSPTADSVVQAVSDVIAELHGVGMPQNAPSLPSLLDDLLSKAQAAAAESNDLQTQLGNAISAAQGAAVGQQAALAAQSGAFAGLQHQLTDLQTQLATCQQGSGGPDLTACTALAQGLQAQVTALQTSLATANTALSKVGQAPVSTPAPVASAASTSTSASAPGFTPGATAAIALTTFVAGFGIAKFIK